MPRPRRQNAPSLIERSSQRQSFHQPSKRRAKNFFAVVLDDGTVSNNDLIEVPIKYPLHRRAHAPTIGNGEPIKDGRICNREKGR